MSSALVRRRDEGLLSGVAAGLGRYLSVDPWIVRAVFVVTAALGGAGLLLYAGAHLVLLDESGRPGERSLPRALLLAAVAAGGAGLVGVVSLGGAPTALVVALVGAALLWREVTGGVRPEGRAAIGRALRQLVATGDDPTARRVQALRLVVGAGVLVAGIGALVATTSSAAAIGPAVLAVTVVLVGAALLASPWLVRLVADLDEERAARIRSEERAEMAAHLHDSVLQTLTLIQRHPERTDEVARLARRQERDLRAWLRESPAEGATLVAALRRAVATVEDDYGVDVSLVEVGDAPLDEGGRQLVAAATEALRNAARHSGCESVSVFAEVGEREIEVNVRDRGPGFDPETIAEDRRGVRESILGRMSRAGGSARVRSDPGRGTEVTLLLPR